MIKFENIFKQVRKSSNVFIMGHKNLDLDALASCVAVYNLIERIHKTAYIIIDEVKHETSINRSLEYINDKLKINIIKYADSKELINKDSLLIIVDTYIEKRIQNPRILKHINNRIFIDHHLFGKPISNKYYIDSSTSSCSEMIAEFYLKKNYRVNKYIATLLYSGIILDTNNFGIKVTTLTHDICSYLIKCGSSTSVANDFIKSNLDEYIKIQKVVFNTDFYKKKYAIVGCNQDKYYDQEEIAKISDTLIMFNNVEASFTVGMINDITTGVSARSNGNVDVSIIMAKLDGGGSKTNAATQLQNKPIGEVINFIKEELK